jgi:uncharacterized protein with HEPN domain
MRRHDPNVRLRHMLDAAREAAALARGRTRADLDADRLLNLALVRLLEIVGEAANRVPSRERKRRPAVPWEEIVGLRTVPLNSARWRNTNRSECCASPGARLSKREPRR